MSESVEICKNM